MPPKRKGKKKRKSTSTASDRASVGVGTTPAAPDEDSQRSTHDEARRFAHCAAECFADLDLDRDPHVAAESCLRAFIASVPGLIERMDALAWTGRDASSVLVLETEPDGSDSRTPALNAVPRSAWTRSGQYFFSLPGRCKSTGYPLRAMFQRLDRDAEYILIAELRHLRHLSAVSPAHDPFFRSCAVLEYF